MNKVSRMGLLIMVGMLVALPIFGQTKQIQTQRRPAANAPASDVAPYKAQDGSGASYILDGLPMLLALHHDTEVGTNKPVDVYMFVIEMQIMNSDGNLEPVGLQIHNYYTRWPQDLRTVFNPHNARDCKIWNGLQTRAMKNRNPKIKTWPYVELVTAVDARAPDERRRGGVV